MAGLVNLMVPAGYKTADLRTIINRVYSFNNAARVPLAFCKHYKFQIKSHAPATETKYIWDQYSLEYKCMTESTGEAARDLKVLYLSESMLFAWKYSISKED